MINIIIFDFNLSWYNGKKRGGKDNLVYTDDGGSFAN